jgi:hypothetical protein
MKPYKLMFSMTASFSGCHPRLQDWSPCDITLADVIRDWPGDQPLEPSEPFDSEYSYLAKEGALGRRILDRLADARGETRFQICRKLKELYPREAFWTCISDVQGSGLFDRETCFGFLDSIGASFETDATMGTLGGPLGIGVVPDMAFHVESQQLISSIRITPILCKLDGTDCVPCRPPSQWQWDAMVDMFKELDAWSLKESGRAHRKHVEA